MTAHRQRRHATLALAVLLAHGLLIWGLVSLAPTRAIAPVGATKPLISWLPLPHASVSPTARAPAEPRPPQTALPGAQRTRQARSFEALQPVPQPTAALPTAPAHPPPLGPTPAPGPGAAQTAAAGAARAASEAPAGTLNLTLPAARGGQAPPAAWAAQDERLHTRPKRDERLAQALGTDTRLHESLRGEVRRFQQGRDCVDAATAREAQLNPFNQSVSATPRQIRPC